MSSIAECYNISDLRAVAKRRLPKGIFEIIDRGTEDDIALRNNRSAIERIKLVPRGPVDVSDRSLSTTIFGVPVGMPLIIAPTGWAGLIWHEGELELARAAKDAGVPFTLATGSMVSLEKVARDVGGRLWFQLYLWPDRKLSHDLVRRADNEGYEALVVTVDTPVRPNWEYSLRNKFGIPFQPSTRNVADILLHPRWLLGTLARYLLAGGMPRLQNHPPDYNAGMISRVGFDASLNWNAIRDLRSIWPRKLLVKGIMHPNDARDAVAAGVDGVIVSNHGGRNLDSALASFDALPSIVDAIRGKTTILVDSGVWRGSDILKAVALGGQAVQVGRATLFGMAAGGRAGAARALALLRHELDTAMAMTGHNTIEQIDFTALAGGSV